MKTASTLLKNGLPVVKEQGDQAQQGFNEGIKKANELLTYLFSELKGCKPAWRLSLPDDAMETTAKREWLLAFLENGINSRELIMVGLSVARRDTSQYWPSCGQFVEWCKMAEFDDIISVELAYLEAANNAHAYNAHVFSHDIVKKAGASLGWRYLQETSQKEAFPLFKRAYEVLVRQLRNGSPLSEVCAGIENKKQESEPSAASPPKPKNKDLAAAHIANLRGLLGA